MRILLVEDDARVARALAALLRTSGNAVDQVSTGGDALLFAGSEDHTAIVLDIGLPDMDGFAVLSELRRCGNTVPILMLTALHGLENRVNGLDLGADDYLQKPFAPEELEARLRALARRRGGDPAPQIEVGTLTINRSSGDVRIAGKAISLGSREAAVLECLAIPAGQTVARDTLLGEVFGIEEATGENAIEVYIARLRAKLKPEGPVIHAVRGFGYRLDDQ